MVCIFQEHNDKPSQTLWSNSKNLVDKQHVLFEKMWNMAIPLSTRKKELEYEKRRNQKKKITDFELIQNKIDSMIIACKKKLIIFSSTTVLCNILRKNNFVNYFPSLLKSGVRIKILLDAKDGIPLNQVSTLNDTTLHNKIQLMHTNEMIDFKEGVIITDDKHLLQTKHDSNNQLVAFYSTDIYI